MNEVELNLTPVLDCFTVLITFLLASAGFLSIGFFEAAIPGGGAPATAPLTELWVRVHPPGIVEIAGKGLKGNRFDLEKPTEAAALEQELVSAGKRSSGRTEIVLVPDDSVGFDWIAKTLGYLNRSKIPITLEEAP